MEKEKLYKINELAAEFYHQQLYKYEEGYQYLEQRKIGNEAKNNFKLGFATGSDNLYQFLKEKGYDDQILEKSNLFFKSYNQYNDRFVDRIIFPIINDQNEMVGFEARALYEALPKYMNTPEVENFKKGENLYGINIAKNTHEGYLVLVEGDIDVITLHEAGIKNVVGIMGTRLTEQQAMLIKKYTDEVVIAFDSDKAGKEATIKAILTLQNIDIKCKAVQIEDAKDPDEYINKYGVKKFKILIDTAIHSGDFKEQIELAQNIKYIKENVDIISIISKYVKLNRTERMDKGTCPFCEKDLFRVDYQTQKFHCFNCNAGGNVIDFISQIKNISFDEAIKYLAKGQANSKNVYLLQTEAYSTRYGELQEKYSTKSGVYSTQEIAIEKGKEWLTERLEELHKSIDVEGTIQDLIDWHAIYYEFKVTEIDPEYADNYVLAEHRYDCESELPTHTEYYYNFKGELISKYYEYRDCYDGESYMTNAYSEKEESKFNAFEVGDLVTVVDDEIPIDRIFVIKEVLDALEYKGYSEYRYALATDIYDEEKNEHYLEDIYEYSERQLNKFEGNIEPDSPIAIISKVYKNTFEISPETERRLIGEEWLNENISFRNKCNKIL